MATPVKEPGKNVALTDEAPRRWHLFREYGLEVSDHGEARSFYGETLTPFTVGGDLRVHVSYEGYSKSFSLKRIVAEAFVPRPFAGNSGLIDFKNGDQTDCRAENLFWKRREQKDRSTTGSIGVSFSKETKRWKAYIVVSRKVIHLGYHETKADAVEAVADANRKLAAGIKADDLRKKRKKKATDDAPKQASA